MPLDEFFSGLSEMNFHVEVGMHRGIFSGISTTTHAVSVPDDGCLREHHKASCK